MAVTGTYPVARIVALVVAGSASPIAAQSPAEPQEPHGVPPWTLAWTPFALAADLPRTAREPLATPALLDPPPRVGLLWTRGNPGALPFEIRDTRTDFRATAASVSGDYRRPFEAQGHTSTHVSGLAWRPVDLGGAMIGRVVADQRMLDGSSAISLRPLGSSPFTTIDTALAEVNHTRVRIEGAGGWLLGRVGVGIAAGYEAHEHRARGTGVPRFGRVAVPAASVGIVTALDEATRIGAHGRWSSSAETTHVVAVADVTMLHRIDGYGEPLGFPIEAGTPYFLRAEHEAMAAGLGAAGHWHGVSWVVFGEVGSLRQTVWTDRFHDDPPKHAWSPNGWTAGAAAQRQLAGALWTLNASWSALSGEARLPDAEEAHFAANEAAFSGSLEARVAPAAHGWTAAAMVNLSYETRDRVDEAAGLATRLETLQQGLAVSGGYTVGGRTLIVAGLARSSYAPRGSIPIASALGPAYRRVLAPDIALNASPATPWSASFGIGHRSSGGTLLWLKGQHESVSPARTAIMLPFRPDGVRAGSSLALGVSFGS
jgi:hypothetical protein